MARTTNENLGGDRTRIKSLADVRRAMLRSRELIDETLTWSDLSHSARRELTEAANHVELVAATIGRAFAGMDSAAYRGEEKEAE